jgi:signal transduction histidine kinase
VLVILIGVLDLITGWELSLFVFYAVPILLAAWYGSRFVGILFALICSATWWLANGAEHPYATGWAYHWASLSRMAYFLFVAIGGTALRLKRDADRERILAMERAGHLEREIVRISEDEQQRIGQDLHDGLCQYLAGVKCALGIVRHDLQNRNIPQYIKLGEIERMMGEAITQTRDMARGISPVMCNEAGLAAALEELAGNSAKLYSQRVLFEGEGEVSEQDLNRAHHLYRIAQEALGNALRHSAAKLIVIKLSGNTEGLRLTISDDGKGLVDRVIDSRGLGLHTMEYRAKIIGADFSIESAPGHGTKVTCYVSRRQHEGSRTGETNSTGEIPVH